MLFTGRALAQHVQGRAGGGEGRAGQEGRERQGKRVRGEQGKRGRGEQGKEGAGKGRARRQEK
jgi:hypothetical protein